MKNKLYQALLLIFLVAGISSCDYLDIVPDERPTEEAAFKDKNAAERYLYSSLIPQHYYKIFFLST